MELTSVKERKPAETRQKLVDSALRLMLRQGFATTTVDEICAEAALTKGSFFHYFDTKGAIGLAAVNHFADVGMDLYSAAWKNPSATALEQLHQLFDIMIGFVERPGEPVVCMVGMLSQEMAQTHPRMRQVCSSHLTAWTEMVITLLDKAKYEQPPEADFDSEEVAWFLNSLWQGSMLISKTQQDPQLIICNLQRARAYVDSLFASYDRTTSRNPKMNSEPEKPMNIPSEAPADRDFLISRTFDAPRNLVFKAWTDPQQMRQWWGPRNFATPVCDMDVRPGGKYRIVMRGQEETDYPITGTYREITEPERLVNTMDCTEHPPEWHDLVNPHRAKDDVNPAGIMVLTATFEEIGAKTKLTARVHFESEEKCAALVKLGMSKGWSESFDRLAELLENKS